MNIRGSTYVPNNKAYTYIDYLVVPLSGLEAWLKRIDEIVFQTPKAKKKNTGVGLITFCHFSKVGSDYVLIKEKDPKLKSEFRIRENFFGTDRSSGLKLG